MQRTMDSIAIGLALVADGLKRQWLFLQNFAAWATSCTDNCRRHQ